MLITLSNGSSDVLAPTDLAMKRTDAGNGKEEVVRHENGGKVYYSLSGYQRESRIPFTFTDRNGNVKKGTIKLNLDYRAEVYIVGFCQPSGDRLGGYVLYNGNKYYSGDVIPFEPDAEGYVTITAVPEEKFANIEYVFKNWKMDTVELTADEVYANPLKFKPSKEYCMIQPQFAGDGRLVVVTDAEYGRAEFKKNGELVEGGEANGIAYGTDMLSVEAIPDDGYVFVRWQVEMNNTITDPDLWVGEKFTEDEQARLLARNTSLSESDIREAKLDFTLEGGGAPLIPVGTEMTSLSFESWLRNIKRLERRIRNAGRKDALLLNRMPFQEERYADYDSVSARAAREMWQRMWLEKKGE